MQKGTSVEDIADMLEEDFSVIQSICNIAEKYAPEYEVEKICNEVENMLWNRCFVETEAFEDCIKV